MVVVVCVVGACQLRAAAVWNLTSDFSIQNGNPNGAWTYGMVVNSQFQSYALNADDGNNRLWLPVGGVPQIGFKYGMPANGVQSGQVYLHPGPNGQACVVQWTAPAGIISPVQVQGQFLPGDSGVMQVGIFVNGIPQETTPYWQSTDSGTFNFALPVAAGDTIRFAVYGGYAFGSTPLQVTITTTNPVISGFIRRADGIPVANVQLTAGSGLSTNTAADGAYSLELTPGWSGTVTPVKAGWAFTPANRAYALVTADVSDQNYLAAPAHNLILGCTLQDGILLLGWPSAEGLRYQLQSTTNLSATEEWVNQGVPFPGTGDVLTTNVPVGPEPIKFFRLQQLDN